MQFWDLHTLLGVQRELIVANGRFLEVQLDDLSMLRTQTFTLR